MTHATFIIPHSSGFHAQNNNFESLYVVLRKDVGIILQSGMYAAYIIQLKKRK